MTPPPLSLYVHMPWCVRKCPYCDFNSHQRGDAAPPRSYIDALVSDFEAELPSIQGRTIETVFFGGGTPSLFAPEEFARLLESLRRLAPVRQDAEITLEANPGTVERGRFSGYRDAGINRVSLGAQSFSPAALARLGRIHSAEDTRRSVEELHAAGLANFNLDLMYALPEQTLEEAIEDVRIGCSLEPRHISHYQLTLEPGTVFAARPPPLPDEDSAFVMQRECQRMLTERGFEQYEVSAFAGPGARCRHNLNYWTFGDYVGIGAGAHGKLTFAAPDDIVRTEKPRQPREYLDLLSGLAGGVFTGSREIQALGSRRRVSAAELPFEFMLNALRLNEGFSIRDFENRTGLAASAVEPALRRAEIKALLTQSGDQWKPTELGSRFLNDLQAGFLE